jgi:hypothetical protein
MLQDESGEVYLQNDQTSENIAELSLIAFATAMIKIQKSRKLVKYNFNRHLLRRIPDYRVRMGFGLHLGWAIEGAIGSQFKIDASYLSPNVNMASRLEAATKQYGVPLLISGDLVGVISESSQEMMRRIDRVTVKGSVKPVDLYTLDMDLSSFVVGAKPALDFSKEELIERNKAKKKDIRDKYINGNDGAICLWKEKSSLLRAIRAAEGSYRKVFDEGLKAYTEGNWSIAKEKFDLTLKMRAQDGPSLALLRYMKSLQFQKPEEWKGYRMLTEK